MRYIPKYIFTTGPAARDSRFQDSRFQTGISGTPYRICVGQNLKMQHALFSVPSTQKHLSIYDLCEN